VGALNDALGRAGFPVASLWAALPHYVSQTPSPKGTLALVEAIGRILEVPIVTADLEIAAASYVRQVNEVVEADTDVAEYVRRLEEDIEEGDGDDDLEDDAFGELPHDLPGGDALAAEVERYLREHRSE